MTGLAPKFKTAYLNLVFRISIEFPIVSQGKLTFLLHKAHLFSPQVSSILMLNRFSGRNPGMFHRVLSRNPQER